jgi:non-heme chloroperoxidase
MTREADGRDYESGQNEGVATHSSYGNPVRACVLTCSYAYSAFTISRGSAALPRIGIVAAGVVAVLTAVPGRSFAQADSPTGLGYIAPMPPRQVPRDDWRDKAPHRAFGVDVTRDVRIHVLDFGGTGTPLVFLSGLSNNAHVWDDFAPRFTLSNRVIAITRRGFGESSHPEDGYDQATLASDVVAVLDSMKIDRAILAGHSIGGYELTHIAATRPERVVGLIYLDAGSDPVSADSIRKAHASALASLDGLPRPPAPENPQPLDADSASPKAAWAYRVRNALTDNTESAVRAAYFYEGFNPYLANKSPFPPKMLAAIRAGGPTPFASVRAPAIFIMATADSIHHQPARVREWAAADPANRAALQRRLDVTSALTRDERAYVARALKGSKTVNIPGARHNIFFSHPDEVEKIMKEFISGIPQDSR